MAQQLRLLAALVEDPGLVPSFHVVPHNHLQLQLQESSTLFWTRHQEHAWSISLHAGKTHNIFSKLLKLEKNGSTELVNSCFCDTHFRIVESVTELLSFNLIFSCKFNDDTYSLIDIDEMLVLEAVYKSSVQCARTACTSLIFLRLSFSMHPSLGFHLTSESLMEGCCQSPRPEEVPADQVEPSAAGA